MNSPTQRDIIFVTFPFSNQIQVKFRPVIIISNNNYNNSSEDVLCVAISSTQTENYYNLTIKNSDLLEGKLNTDSKIKCDTITLIDKKVIRKKIGTISPVLFEKVKERIISLIN